MGRAFARPLILPWTWILSNLSSNIYASLLSLDGFGVHMGKEAKGKRFVKIIVDVGHKMGAKWDEKLSREAVFEP